MQTISRRGEPATPALCANAHGLSLHAAVRCGAGQRQQLERLCRYITRPAIANERLKRNRAGQALICPRVSIQAGALSGAKRGRFSQPWRLLESGTWLTNQ